MNFHFPLFHLPLSQNAIHPKYMEARVAKQGLQLPTDHHQLRIYVVIKPPVHPKKQKDNCKAKGRLGRHLNTTIASSGGYCTRRQEKDNKFKATVMFETEDRLELLYWGN